jgi:hypothetical protein
VDLKPSEIPLGYEYRKVWREGLKVAMKVKGSQGNPQIEWLKQEHQFTATSPKSDVQQRDDIIASAIITRL